MKRPFHIVVAAALCAAGTAADATDVKTVIVGQGESDIILPRDVEVYYQAPRWRLTGGHCPRGWL